MESTELTAQYPYGVNTANPNPETHAAYLWCSIAQSHVDYNMTDPRGLHGPSLPLSQAMKRWEILWSLMTYPSTKSRRVARASRYLFLLWTQTLF